MSYWSQWSQDEIRSEQGYEEYEHEDDSVDYECERHSEEEEEESFYCDRCCDSGCNSCLMLEY